MSKRRNIWFFIPPKVHILDLTGPVQVFYEASDYGAAYDLRYIAAEDDLVSAAGLPFGRIGHYAAAAPQSGDFLFIPGADIDYLRSKKFKGDKKLFDWLRALPEKGVSLCSVCTGAFFLAEAGLLNGRKCTTHWKRSPELKRVYPKALVEENILFVHSDHIYTSAGITSGIDLSLSIIEDHYGPLFTHKVARELVVYYRRSDSHSQESVYLDCRNHLNMGVHAVQDWLIENLHQKFTIESLASIAHMSPRNLTRTFRKATEMSIIEYVKRLRLEKAEALGGNPGLSADSIAAKVGYSNARQLRRIKATKKK
ncbi:MAG TPA: DJ-1/PfpI family protein [Mucilaginibacter sp.]|jgi:transcriptional regulator GlxA family with amidase domain|nr:DJ-1/PfpI family protein [Mucilaginibacter sp.]